MSDTLLHRTIKLAYESPELRHVLLPLIKQASDTLTSEEVAAEVCSFVFGSLAGLARSMQAPRNVVQAWDAMEKSIDSRLDAYAKERGYSRRAMLQMVGSLDLLDRSKSDKAWSTMQKRRLDVPTGAAALVYFAGAEAQKISSKLKGELSFVDREANTAVSTAWTFQKGGGIFSEEELEKIRRLALPYSKGVASRMGKAIKLLEGRSGMVFL